MSVLAIFLAVYIGGIGGALTGVWLYSRGERRRFDAELAPLKMAIAEVADSFDHWTKRERRRQYVGRGDAAEPRDGPVPTADSPRQEQLRAVARRMPPYGGP